MSKGTLIGILRDQVSCHQRIADEAGDIILRLAEAITGCLRNSGKVLLCGNGGSAADAQHVAAELVGRYRTERQALPAIALTTDTSILTAVGNDYGFDEVFARQVAALARPGDVVVGISTSGNSANILRALEVARYRQAMRIGFTGGDGGKLKEQCDLCFIAPSGVTARIQELHISVWHAVCELIDDAFTQPPSFTAT